MLPERRWVMAQVILGTLAIQFAFLCASAEPYLLQPCIRFKKYEYFVERIQAGRQWRERCRTCRCANGEVTCSLDAGKTCATEYDPSVDRHCLEWDKDQCCCYRVGCRHDGKEYNFGLYMPSGKDEHGCTRQCLCNPHVSDECSSVC